MYGRRKPPPPYQGRLRRLATGSLRPCTRSDIRGSPESLTCRIDTPFLVVEGHLVVEGEAAGEALGARPGLVLVEARQRPLADVAAWGRRGMEGKLPEMPRDHIIQNRRAHLDEKRR